MTDIANLIQPYNPNWSIAFEKIASKLNTALEGVECVIVHVGSTAIPGLCAKPIIDIDIIVATQAQLITVSLLLAQIGYINKGAQGITDRIAFRQNTLHTPNTVENEHWPAHHLYVCIKDSLALRNHLIMKTALLADAELVAEYAALKMKLVHTIGMTRAEYNKAKTTFVLSVLAANGISKTELAEIKAANE